MNKEKILNNPNVLIFNLNEKIKVDQNSDIKISNDCRKKLVGFIEVIISNELKKKGK